MKLIWNYKYLWEGLKSLVPYIYIYKVKMGVLFLIEPLRYMSMGWVLEFLPECNINSCTIILSPFSETCLERPLTWGTTCLKGATYSEQNLLYFNVGAASTWNLNLLPKTNTFLWPTKRPFKTGSTVLWKLKGQGNRLLCICITLASMVSKMFFLFFFVFFFGGDAGGEGW